MNRLARCIVIRGCDETLHFHAHIFRAWGVTVVPFKPNLVSFCISIYKLKRFERYLDCLFQKMRRFLSHRVYLHLWQARERETGGYFSRVRFYEIKVKASKYLLYIIYIKYNLNININ